jgi:hypothetical protein
MSLATIIGITWFERVVISQNIGDLSLFIHLKKKGRERFRSRPWNLIPSQKESLCRVQYVYAPFCLIRGGAVGAVNAVPGIGVKQLHLPVRDASDDSEMIVNT